MTQCTAIRSGTYRCERDGTVELTHMCVHEHKQASTLCATHGALFSDLTRVSCRWCEQADGHRCLISVTSAAPLTEDATA